MKTLRLLLTSLALCLITVIGFTTNAHAEKPVQLRGYVAAKTMDCLNPDKHNHAPHYFIVDDETGEKLRIKGHDAKLRKVRPRQKISIKGLRRSKIAAGASSETSISDEPVNGPNDELEVQEIELLPMTEEAVAQEAAIANGANELTMLSTLLVFISTDTHGCMTSEANARALLFDNPRNANEGMQVMTKGRYGLQLGNGTGVPEDHIVRLHIPVNSADHNSDSIEAEAMFRLFYPYGARNRFDWNRILLFAPDGITDSNFTAYAAYPWGSYTTHGMMSHYGRSYGNNYMNGYLHELGHNLGLGHSQKGGDKYGDRTCVMGVSHKTTVSQVYNVTKLNQTGWLDAFPNANLSVTTDTTINLYPLSSDPNVTSETISVNFPGTNYYASYLRDQRPYGYLSESGDKDKVFIHTLDTGLGPRSYQKANIAVGGSYTGPGTVHFERYGPNNAYATVSFDMADGNTKPVANPVTDSTAQDTQKIITLSGSDADSGDTLVYETVTSPAHGSLSAVSGNTVTYTPTAGYMGADSFVFSVNDGKISSFATVSITVTEQNTPPVADNQNETIYYNTARALALTATDGNGDPLSYSIVANPSHGTLSAVAGQTVTYTPNADYSGSDSFTFKANDTMDDSNVATVTLDVLTTPNTAPDVYAGAKKSRLIGGIPWTPKDITTTAWYDASDAGSITAIGGKVSQWNDKSGNGNHATQDSSAEQPTTGASIGDLNALNFNADVLNTSLTQLETVSMYLVVDANQITGNSNNCPIGATSTYDSGGCYITLQSYSDASPIYWPNYQGSALSNTSLHAVSGGPSHNFQPCIISHSGTGLSTESFTYKIGTSRTDGTQSYLGTIGEIIICPQDHDEATRQKLEGYLAHKWGQTGNLVAGHQYETDVPLTPGVVVQLDDATAIDPDGDDFDVSWEVVSTDPPGLPDPIFSGDVTLGTAAATFTAIGKYTLSLTGDDGMDTGTSSVEVTITDGSTPSPTADAGSPQTVTDTDRSGGEDVTLDGSGSIDPDGTIVSYVWNDGTSDITTDVAPTVTLPVGTHTLTLTVTDNDGLTGTDTVVIRVNAPPLAYAGADKPAILGTASPAWTPSEIAPAAWYDASDTGSITAAIDGKVSQWNDKSDNGRNATQTTELKQPTSGGDIGGSNALYFDGSDDTMSFPALGLTDDAMMICVYAPNNDSSGYSVMGNQTEANDNHDVLGGSGSSYPHHFRTDRIQDVALGIPTSGANMLAHMADSGASEYRIRLNGSDTYLNSGAFTFADNVDQIGGTFITFLDGWVGEVIILNDYSLINMQKAEGYLAHKWGLTGNLPVGHPYKDSAPDGAEPAVAVTLSDATVSDADEGASLSQSWTLVSKPVGAADPTFSSSTALKPTVSFTAIGTYELRLTADDTFDTHSDDVTITIDPPLPAIYATWANGDNFANPFNNPALDADPDGDGVSSLLEFAFGTDPTANDSRFMAADGSTHGQPMAASDPSDPSDGMWLYFLRRTDHGTAGSVTFSTEFSTDLSSFTPSSAGLVPADAADQNASPGYQVMKIPYPAESRFGRVAVEATPE